jgi:hypothetical protein
MKILIVKPPVKPSSRREVKPSPPYLSLYEPSIQTISFKRCITLSRMTKCLVLSPAMNSGNMEARLGQGEHHQVSQLLFGLADLLPIVNVDQMRPDGQDGSSGLMSSSPTRSKPTFLSGEDTAQ